MPYNRPPPEVRSRQPDRFYCVAQANSYHSDANNEIQKDITILALTLLPESAQSTCMLDIGCGSGLSTQHLPSHSVGLDISLSMLQLASQDAHGYVCAAAFALPFRDNSFEYAISVSMLQWLSPEQLQTFFQEFARVITPTGNAVFQVYPLDLAHANEMVEAAQKETGGSALLIADFPHKNSAIKWFLCVDRSTMTTDDDPVYKCPLARRMDGSCAYSYRRRRGLTHGRLIHEHLQYAWHAYRKVSREKKLKEDNTTKRHRKERTVFPNEERLVAGLIADLGEIITLDQLKDNAELVVDIMHNTFP